MPGKVDIEIIKFGAGTRSFVSEDRTTSSVTAAFVAGEVAKRNGTYPLPIATGDAEVGTDELIGVVNNTSTDTSTVDGVVDIELFIPGLTEIRGAATTSTNINTAAKLYAYIFGSVSFDLTAASGTNGIFTIDEDETDDPNVHCISILGGDIESYTIDGRINALTCLGSSTV